MSANPLILQPKQSDRPEDRPPDKAAVKNPELRVRPWNNERAIEEMEKSKQMLRDLTSVQTTMHDRQRSRLMQAVSKKITDMIHSMCYPDDELARVMRALNDNERRTIVTEVRKGLSTNNGLELQGEMGELLRRLELALGADALEINEIRDCDVEDNSATAPMNTKTVNTKNKFIRSINFSHLIPLMMGILAMIIARQSGAGAILGVSIGITFWFVAGWAEKRFWG